MNAYSILHPTVLSRVARRRRGAPAALSMALCLWLGGAAVQAQPSHRPSGHGFSMTAGGQLQWVDVPSLPAGAKIAVLEGRMNAAEPFTARLRLPANYRIPPHWHPAIEHVTVLSGIFHMGHGEAFDGARATALPRGGFAVMQARTPHFAFTTNEPAEIQLHGVGPWGVTYINAQDDPRRRP